MIGTACLATMLMCVIAWTFVRTRRGWRLLALLFGLSAIGFLVCLVRAVPGAMDVGRF